MRKSSFVRSIQIETNLNFEATDESALKEFLALINKNKDNLTDRIKQNTSQGFFEVTIEGEFRNRFIEIPSSSTVVSLYLKSSGASVPVIYYPNLLQFQGASEEDIIANAIPDKPVFVFYSNGIFVINNKTPDGTERYVLTIEQYPPDYTLDIFKDLDDDVDINTAVTETTNEPKSVFPPEMHTTLIYFTIRDILNTPIAGGQVDLGRLDRANLRAEAEMQIGLKALVSRSKNEHYVFQKPVTDYF